MCKSAFPEAAQSTYVCTEERERTRRLKAVKSSGLAHRGLQGVAERGQLWSRTTDSALAADDDGLSGGLHVGFTMRKKTFVVTL